MKGMFGVFALLLTAAPVGAQQVYKCEAGGQTVYQSHPCENSPASKTWDARRYAVSPERQAQINRERVQAERVVASNRQSVAASRVPSQSMPWSPDKHNKACEDAKAYRERMLKILGLKRTYDDLQRLDEGVYRACKP